MGVVMWQTNSQLTVCSPHDLWLQHVATPTILTEPSLIEMHVHVYSTGNKIKLFYVLETENSTIYCIIIKQTLLSSIQLQYQYSIVHSYMYIVMYMYIVLLYTMYM